MRKICIINQKGGVGKTTSTISIARALANEGRRVLIIDCDPQGNVADCLGIWSEKGLYEFLLEEKPLDECVQSAGTNLDVLPARENLTKAELVLAGETARETYFKRMFAEIIGYDYVLLDCPPSLGLLNQNALLYANEAIIPTSTDALGLDALKKMFENIETINDAFGHSLTISAIIPTLFDTRLKSCKEALVELQNSHYEIVTEPIRLNSKLREAPKQQKDIFATAKSSRGAQDYKKAARFLQHQEKNDEEQLAALVAETA